MRECTICEPINANDYAWTVSSPNSDCIDLIKQGPIVTRRVLNSRRLHILERHQNNCAIRCVASADKNMAAHNQSFYCVLMMLCCVASRSITISTYDVPRKFRLSIVRRILSFLPTLAILDEFNSFPELFALQ